MKNVIALMTICCMLFGCSSKVVIDHKNTHAFSRTDRGCMGFWSFVPGIVGRQSNVDYGMVKAFTENKNLLMLICISSLVPTMLLQTQLIYRR